MPIINFSVKTRDVNWSHFVGAVNSVRGMRTEIGLLEDKFVHEPKARAQTFEELVGVAATNEFGSASRKIPERALFRITFKQIESKIGQMLGAGGSRIFLGISSVEKTLYDIGEFVEKKLKENLMNKMPPPNAPRTIRKKGFDHPLLETGQLLNNINHREIRR